MAAVVMATLIGGTVEAAPAAMKGGTAIAVVGRAGTAAAASTTTGQAAVTTGLAAAATPGLAATIEGTIATRTMTMADMSTVPEVGPLPETTTALAEREGEGLLIACVVCS